MNSVLSLEKPWVITWKQQLDAAKEMYQLFWDEVHKHRDVPVVLFEQMPTVQRDAWIEVARASFYATGAVAADVANKLGAGTLAMVLRNVSFEEQPS